MKNTNLLQIIDWECKGNLVRFYLGENGKQWGDDWNDAPYEHNAGRVYQEFIVGWVDVVFDWYVDIWERCDGFVNTTWSKEHFIKRETPFMSAVIADSSYRYKNFDDTVALALNENSNDRSPVLQLFYFGDHISVLEEMDFGRIINVHFNREESK